MGILQGNWPSGHLLTEMIRLLIEEAVGALAHGLLVGWLVKIFRFSFFFPLGLVGFGFF